ncbi:hypothetical protein BDN72DRAFT_116261 [Pluteus cervinus]|uniref:Uncharacterized protein n=1 Tax=Pluteus cervinus TaxID=181527 RepID=A0ACD3AM97_9AGAR|nr:hypothetical protein BDN72DRAFT_116261 [Pluteus cervinus]
MWERFIKRPCFAVAKPILRPFGVVVQVERQVEEEGAGMVAKVGKMVNAIKELGKSEWWMAVLIYLVRQPIVLVIPLVELFGDDEVHDHATHVSTFYGMEAMDDTPSLVLRLSCFVGTIFGAIHFLSWHSSFPTHTELLLWRISSIALVAEPGLLFLASFFEGGFIEDLFIILAGFTRPIPYILTRFCLPSSPSLLLTTSLLVLDFHLSSPHLLIQLEIVRLLK